MTKAVGCSLAAILLANMFAAEADTASFDRPGISFSTGIVPRGSVSLEQGLPGFQHSSDGGVRSTRYSADTNVRFGFIEGLEFQVATSPFIVLKTEGAGASDTARGYGDTSLALKLALPSTMKNFSWAALARVTLATGEAPFSTEKPQYDLATALNLALNETSTAGLYVDYSRLDGQSTYTFSPSISFALTRTVATYLEAGASYTRRSPTSAIAGGGLTWMVTRIVQLDISADFGLNSKSPDVQAGFGVSIFIE